MYKTFTEDEIFSIIDQEARDLNMTVIVDGDVPFDIYLANFMAGGNIIGLACPEDLTVHLFMNPIMKLNQEVNDILVKMGIFAKLNGWVKNPEQEMRKLIRKFLLHEGRHIQQYEYLSSKGVDLVKYFEKENKEHSYYLRKHEIDAYLVQWFGIRLPLSWLF